MVYCVQGLLVYGDAATRDGKLAQAQDAIVGRGTWDVTRTQAIESPDGPAAYVEARFIGRDDQLAVNNALKFTGALPDVSWVQIHDCPHDEGGDACSATVERTVL